MPVHQGPNNSPLAFYWAIPPVTRVLVTTILASRLALALGVLPLPYMYLSWPLVFSKLQVWRLLTAFIVLPASGFEFLIHIIWTIQYGRILESSTFMNRTADFLWMLIVGGGAMLTSANLKASLAAHGVQALTLVPIFRAYFLASSLTEMLLYVWSRHFPTAQVSIMGLVTVQAFYLPFVYVVLAVLLGSDWRPSVIGILSGHLYYYLTTIYPATGGRTLVQTPQWLKRILLQYGIGRVDAREVPSVANPAAPGFRPFSGTGRRLA